MRMSKETCEDLIVEMKEAANELRKNGYRVTQIIERGE